LARALVNRPEVLLLDEPLGALDLKLRKAMQLELKSLNREVGVTFIYVTHDQEEALTMSDRIAVMSEGRILQIGSPNEIYERPRNRFVADFIGQTNFIEGIARGTHGELADVGIAGSGVIRGGLPDGLHASGTVAVAVRPERVAFAQDLESETPSSWNTLDGVIRDVIYLGTHSQYVVQLPAGQLVVVHRQNRSGGAASLEIGAPAQVVFDPVDATILIS
jgi:spermidine/putrescine transport system ATP-binding protein